MDASYRRSRESGQHGRSRASYLLYTGLAVFCILMALTVQEIRSAWNQARARGRAEAVLDLVQVHTPTRTVHKPGAIAWLDHQMLRYERSRSGDRGTASTVDSLPVSADPGPVPAIFEPMAEALVDALDGLEPAPADSLRPMVDEEVCPPGVEPAEDRLHFRSQNFLDYRDGQWFVLTRRSVFDAPSHEANASDRFVRWAAPYIEAARVRIAALGPIPGPTPPSLVRIYALAEDGTFLSLPWIDSDATTQERKALTWQEGMDLRKRPQQPNFVTNEFFFRFDFTRPLLGQAHHSGLYFDVAGHGLVTTITLPVRSADGSIEAVIAIDLTLEVDWRRFAASVEPPLIAHLASLKAPGSGGWQPWSELQRSVARQRDDGETVPPRLANVLDHLAEEERRTGTEVSDGETVPPRLAEVLDHLAEEERRTGTEVYTSAEEHHKVVPDLGALAIFQVAQRDWLMVFFPEIPTRFPVLAVSLLAFLGLVLLGGFERNRRRAEAAQVRAEREVRERQSLLNAMRIPITVVDPNTDLVVSANDAAAAIGIVTGSCIGDLVTGDDGREHYQRMQRARGERRRAYGVPLAIPRADGPPEHRLALIRSIAITSPIASFQADERHRLGILFLVEPEADLPLFTRGIELAARDNERRRLASLLTHGIDTLAHVLAARLAQEGEADPCARWLADYLGRRVRVTAWLLDRWHETPPLPPETTLEASQLQATLDRLQEVFAHVRDDPALRARLHWSNGLLAEPATGEVDQRVFAVDIHWPASVLFTLPVRGGAGLFLEEVLINAVRHGRPATRPRITIIHEPVRRELVFSVSNLFNPGLGVRSEADRKSYGGIAIVTRLAHLFGWHDLRFDHQDERFVASWRIPVSERPAPGDSD